VAVCPVDCIYRYTGEDHEKFPNQLFIHPDECIDCGACEPACPWQSIFEEIAVPKVFQDDIQLNYDIMSHMTGFEVAPHLDKTKPTVVEIQDNKLKWGYV